MKHQLEKAELIWIPTGNQTLNLGLVEERHPSKISKVNSLKVLFPLQNKVPFSQLRQLSQN